jgi:phosphate-selective porin OprO/OprP
MVIRIVFLALATAFLPGSITSAKAGNPVVETSGGAEITVEKKRLTLTDAFDALWAIPVLYRNPDNPYLQELAVIGRYQGQVWGINSDYGSSYGWENRRQRVGGRIRFLKTFEGIVNFNLNFNGANTGRFVRNFDEFGLTWNPHPVFQIEAGLFKVPITNEWRTSSNRMVTIERSDFINMAVPNRLGGVLATGEVPAFTEKGKFTYGLGAYTGSRTENWAVPSFEGGAMIYGGIGYKFNKNHLLRFDNGYLTDSPGNNATRPYTYTTALSYVGSFLDEKIALESDLVMAIGQNDTPNLYGIIILPSYMLTDRIQLVTRYQYLVSNQDNGVRLQSRYEQRAPDLPTTVGNNYHALYAGVNYYIYRDRMKIMGGLEYSHMNLSTGSGYNQMTLFGAFRVWF